MTVETAVAEHYAISGLITAIEAGLVSDGKSAADATVDDLGPVDEFHIGGRGATVELYRQLVVAKRSKLLDIGCGIGGTARLLASNSGCTVTGLDLTPAYIQVARTLTGWTGLSDRISYRVGSAIDMPFEDASFDAATLLHVGMNIEDKMALFREARRVLQPNGRLGVYDIMRTSDREFDFPVPWASDASHSFVDDPDTYRGALIAAGFEIERVRDRGGFASDFFAARRERKAGSGGPSPLGLHLIIGEDAPQKLANMIAAVDRGVIAPLEMICRTV